MIAVSTTYNAIAEAKDIAGNLPIVRYERSHHAVSVEADPRANETFFRARAQETPTIKSDSPMKIQ